MRRSVDFWYFLISRRATVPGLKRWGFLTPVVTGADFLAIFWATSCFLGTFWAVDFLAVCFVRAIVNNIEYRAFSLFQSPSILFQKILNLIGSFSSNQNQLNSAFQIKNESSSQATGPRHGLHRSVWQLPHKSVAVCFVDALMAAQHPFIPICTLNYHCWRIVLSISSIGAYIIVAFHEFIKYDGFHHYISRLRDKIKGKGGVLTGHIVAGGSGRGENEGSLIKIYKWACI